MANRTIIDNIKQFQQYIGRLNNVDTYILEIKYCEITFEVSLNDIVNLFNKKIIKFSVWNCVFKEHVKVQSCNFYSDEKTIFEKNMILSGVYSDEETVKVQIGGVINNNLLINNAFFSSLLIFADVKENVRIWSCTILSFSFSKTDETKILMLDNCSFKDCVDFSQKTYNKVDFFRVKFDNTVTFENTVFKDDAIFCELYLKHDLYFENATFEKRLTLENMTFPNILSLNHATIAWLKIENIYFVKQPLNMANLSVEKVANRETARFLKHEAIQRHNNPLAIYFNTMEMTEYWRETKICQFPEFVLLSLNFLSNRFGKSWIQGIIFTIGVWILFFGIFVMIRDSVGTTFIFCVPELRKEAIEYFWLPNGIEGLFSKEMNVSWWAIVSFFLGKILIGYGIFQTIAAFRKYGKN